MQFRIAHKLGEHLKTCPGVGVGVGVDLKTPTPESESTPMKTLSTPQPWFRDPWPSSKRAASPSESFPCQCVQIGKKREDQTSQPLLPEPLVSSHTHTHTPTQRQTEIAAAHRRVGTLQTRHVPCKQHAPRAESQQICCERLSEEQCHVRCETEQRGTGTESRALSIFQGRLNRAMLGRGKSCPLPDFRHNGTWYRCEMSESSMNLTISYIIRQNRLKTFWYDFSDIITKTTGPKENVPTYICTYKGWFTVFSQLRTSKCDSYPNTLRGGRNNVLWREINCGNFTVYFNRYPYQLPAREDWESTFTLLCVVFFFIYRPEYMSRKICNFRTDKFDTWNKRKFWLM